MVTGEKGIQLIKHFESFRPLAYLCSAGVWTIGYGTTVIDGNPVRRGMYCTEPEALVFLAKDLHKFETKVTELTKGPFGPITAQNQFDALVCFTYNVGYGAFGISTLRKKVNARLPVSEKNFTDWHKIRVKGVLTPSFGLIRRRKAEFHLFSTGNVKFNF